MKLVSEIGLDQGLMTNGTYAPELNEAILDNCKWVRFSLDSVDRDEYRETKGADLCNVVKDNIHKLVSLKRLRDKPISIGVNLNLMQKAGYKETIRKLSSFCKDSFVDYFQIRPALPTPGQKLDLKILNKQIDYLKTLKGINVSWDKFLDLQKVDYNRHYTRCAGQMFESVIHADGNMYACMYRLEPRFFIGNISDGFTKVWSHKEIIPDLKNCQVCCKCHEINKLINLIENKSIKDVNFI